MSRIGPEAAWFPRPALPTPRRTVRVAGAPVRGPSNDGGGECRRQRGAPAPQRDAIVASRRTRTPHADFGAALSFDVSRVRGLLRTDAGEQATPPREWERGLHSPITMNWRLR